MAETMKPERRLFRVEAGEYFESEAGSVRDCFPIRLSEPRIAIVADLRRDHGFEVALARNPDFGLDYLVSGRPDGKMTEAQVMKINLLYGRHLDVADGDQ